MSETLNLLYFRGNSQLIKKSILESITEGYIVKIECDKQTFVEILDNDKELSGFFKRLINQGVLMLEIKSAKVEDSKKRFSGFKPFIK